MWPWSGKAPPNEAAAHRQQPVDDYVKPLDRHAAQQPTADPEPPPAPAKPMAVPQIGRDQPARMGETTLAMIGIARSDRPEKPPLANSFRNTAGIAATWKNAASLTPGCERLQTKPPGLL